MLQGQGLSISNSPLAKPPSKNDILIGNGLGNGDPYIGHNITIGDNIATNNKTGAYNLYLGSQVAQNDTGSTYNIGLGYQALINSVNSSYNIAIGYKTLQNSAATDNIAIGRTALLYNTSGYSNIGVGPGALVQNTTGTNNVALGQGALYSNTNGIYNIGIGTNSLYYTTNSSYNTGIGDYTLYKIQGSENTAVGANVLQNDTLGNNNTVIGAAAFNNAAKGSNTVALGYEAGLHLTGDVSNLFIVNNRDLARTGLDTTLSLFYGRFATDTTLNNQYLNINVSQLNVSGNTNFTNHSITAGPINGTSININQGLTTIAGTQAGSIYCQEPYQGATYKKVLIYFNGFLETSGGKTYTFPVPFTYTPAVVTINQIGTSNIVSISTTSITVDASTATTGFLILEGW